MSFTLLANAEVYAPTPLGRVGVLVLDDRIVDIGKEARFSSRLDPGFSR